MKRSLLFLICSILLVIDYYLIIQIINNYVINCIIYNWVSIIYVYNLKIINIKFLSKIEKLSSLLSRFNSPS